MYKYRFKTKEELYSEFGEYWEETVDMNEEGYMNYLLGSDIIIPDEDIDENGNVINGFQIINISPEYSYNRTWQICPELIIKENTTPFYMLSKEERQKRFIYE